MSLLEKSEGPIGGKYSDSGFANSYNKIKPLIEKRREKPSILNIYRAMRLAAIDDRISELDAYNLEKEKNVLLKKEFNRLMNKRNKLNSKLKPTY